MNDFDEADATPDTRDPARRVGDIRPVTIRQLAQANIREPLTRPGSKLRYLYSLGGNDFSVATFVGNIIDVEVSGETTRTVRIEDGTGKITSTMMIQKGHEAEDPPRRGAYARVYGVPRKFKEAVVFEIHSIRPVEDPHEVFFHLMEAMVVTLKHSRGPPPRLYESQYAKAVGPPLPPLNADPDISISMRSFVLNSPPLRGRTSPEAPATRADSDPHDTLKPDPSGSGEGVEAEAHDTSDDDGSTQYYTDQPSDPTLERSPSPTPMNPFAKNHSYEGHSDRGEGSSSQLPRSTQEPDVLSSDEGSGDGRTPRRKFKGRRGVDVVLARSPQKGSDEELEDIRSELSSQIVRCTPPRELRPDPYTGWSSAKRDIMILLGSKIPGEEVNLKRSLGEGRSKLEFRNAIRELVKEGEIETADGINYRLSDKGPAYPRF